MGSSGCRARVSFPLVLLGLAVVTGCAGRTAAPSARDAAAATAPGAPPAQDPGIELPAGPGRELLLSRCLGCHDLGGLELFGDFYTREDWHQLLETMVAHGANVDTNELEIVADYLGLHYSPEP
jgi:hypothetical protein